MDWNPLSWNPGGHPGLNPINMLAGPVGEAVGMGRELFKDTGGKKGGGGKGTAKSEAAPASAPAAAPEDPVTQLVTALQKAFPQLGQQSPMSATAFPMFMSNVVQPQFDKATSAVSDANKQYEGAMQQLLGKSNSPTAKMMMGQMPGVEAMNTGIINSLNSAIAAAPAAQAQMQTQQAQQTDSTKLLDMFQKLMSYMDLSSMSGQSPLLGGITGLGGGGLGLPATAPAGAGAQAPTG